MQQKGMPENLTRRLFAPRDERTIPRYGIDELKGMRMQCVRRLFEYWDSSLEVGNVAVAGFEMNIRWLGGSAAQCFIDDHQSQRSSQQP